MRPRERAAELKLFRERVERNPLKSAKNGRGNEREEENAAKGERAGRDIQRCLRKLAH